ncbi:extensin family protein [Sphingomonas sp. AOB5]|uniref:extensin-like domain-containing protein n=1 Tax=Sphingomonas sp. AOB5 TaxID=3034017 RepID=UPI0023F84C3C|nr:extensin family protein [Sphingomonas sp. AOB5]MDF7777439.1 extensin family protein [Sphingomonas sp. AOB5]
MRIRWPGLILLPLLLAGCMFGEDDYAPRPAQPSAPIRERPSGPITLNDPTPRDTQQCFTALTRDDVQYSPLPDRDYGGGCIVTGSVQLLDIGVPVTNLKAIKCPLARTFTGWVRYAVAPASAQILGSELAKVETYGTYACRGVVGRGAEGARKMSEHGLANAVDISAFVLKDGRRITIEHGWRSSDPDVRRFMETIHKSACRRFQTVLSPDYNAAHYNHLHFDMGKGPFCR